MNINSICSKSINKLSILKRTIVKNSRLGKKKEKSGNTNIINNSNSSSNNNNSSSNNNSNSDSNNSEKESLKSSYFIRKKEQTLKNVTYFNNQMKPIMKDLKADYDRKVELNKLKYEKIVESKIHNAKSSKMYNSITSDTKSLHDLDKKDENSTSTDPWSIERVRSKIENLLIKLKDPNVLKKIISPAQPLKLLFIASINKNAPFSTIQMIMYYYEVELLKLNELIPQDDLQLFLDCSCNTDHLDIAELILSHMKLLNYTINIDSLIKSWTKQKKYANVIDTISPLLKDYINNNSKNLEVNYLDYFPQKSVLYFVNYSKFLTYNIYFLINNMMYLSFEQRNWQLFELTCNVFKTLNDLKMLQVIDSINWMIRCLGYLSIDQTISPNLISLVFNLINSLDPNSEKINYLSPNCYHCLNDRLKSFYTKSNLTINDESIFYSQFMIGKLFFLSDSFDSQCVDVTTIQVENYLAIYDKDFISLADTLFSNILTHDLIASPFLFEILFKFVRSKKNFEYLNSQLKSVNRILKFGNNVAFNEISTSPTLKKYSNSTKYSTLDYQYYSGLCNSIMTSSIYIKEFSTVKAMYTKCANVTLDMYHKLDPNNPNCPVDTPWNHNFYSLNVDSRLIMLQSLIIMQETATTKEILSMLFEDRCAALTSVVIEFYLEASLVRLKYLKNSSLYSEILKEIDSIELTWLDLTGLNLIMMIDQYSGLYDLILNNNPTKPDFDLPLMEIINNSYGKRFIKPSSKSIELYLEILQFQVIAIVNPLLVFYDSVPNIEKLTFNSFSMPKYNKCLNIYKKLILLNSTSFLNSFGILPTPVMFANNILLHALLLPLCAYSSSNSQTSSINKVNVLQKLSVDDVFLQADRKFKANQFILESMRFIWSKFSSLGPSFYSNANVRSSVIYFLKVLDIFKTPSGTFFITDDEANENLNSFILNSFNNNAHVCPNILLTQSPNKLFYESIYFGHLNISSSLLSASSFLPLIQSSFVKYQSSTAIELYLNMIGSYNIPTNDSVLENIAEYLISIGDAQGFEKLFYNNKQSSKSFMIYYYQLKLFLAEEFLNFDKAEDSVQKIIDLVSQLESKIAPLFFERIDSVISKCSQVIAQGRVNIDAANDRSDVQEIKSFEKFSARTNFSKLLISSTSEPVRFNLEDYPTINDFRTQMLPDYVFSVLIEGYALNTKAIETSFNSNKLNNWFDLFCKQKLIEFLFDSNGVPSFNERIFLALNNNSLSLNYFNSLDHNKAPVWLKLLEVFIITERWNYVAETLKIMQKIRIFASWKIVMLFISHAMRMQNWYEVESLLAVRNSLHKDSSEIDLKSFMPIMEYYISNNKYDSLIKLLDSNPSTLSNVMIIKLSKLISKYMGPVKYNEFVFKYSFKKL